MDDAIRMLYRSLEEKISGKVIVKEEYKEAEKVMNGVLNNSKLEIRRITKLENAHGTVISLTSEMMFIQGFQLGARFMKEALEDTEKLCK